MGTRLRLFLSVALAALVPACGGGGGSGGPGAAPLFGLAGSFPVMLSRVDASTGATTLVSGRGLAGFPSVDGLAYDAANGVLLGVDTQTQELVSIDPASGAPTLVGPLGRDLSALEVDPDTGTIYSVDNTNGVLVTVNRNSGATTVVGPHNLLLGFISGLAYDSDNDVLYGSNTTTNGLVTLNTATGNATAAGPLGFANVDGLAYDAVADVLYGVSGGGSLITINTATGAGTLVYSFGYKTRGLAFSGGTLFGVDYERDVLLSIPPTIGSATLRGNLAYSSPAGIAYDPGLNTLWAVDSGVTGSSGALYRIHPVTGATTFIAYLNGPITFAIGCLGFDSDTDTLYAVDNQGAGSQLYTIHKTTAASTLIGSNLGAFDLHGLAYNAGTNTMYGMDRNQSQLVTVNTATGVATAVGGNNGTGGGGLAYDPVADILYTVLNNAGTDQIRELTPATGAISAPIGTPGLQETAALTFDTTRGRIVGVDYMTLTPYAYDVAEDSATTLGGLGAVSVETSAWDPTLGVFHAVENVGMELLRIDPVTGTSRYVAPVATTGLRGLALVEGTLYGLEFGSRNLLTINPATGAVAVVGNLGPTFTQTRGLTYDPALNLFYVSDLNTMQLLAVNRSTGAATPLGPLTDAVLALAYDRPTRTLFGLTGATQLVSVNTASGALGSLGNGRRAILGLSSQR